MKTPIEHVRVSAKGKDVLIKTKRHTGLTHWNEICRIALCLSLANPTTPPKRKKDIDSNIDMDWKTLSGNFQEVLSAVTILRAQKDGIDPSNKEELAEYFRAHLERGIFSLQNVKCLKEITDLR
jgi:DNA sulfur modification protein DndE